MRDLARWACLLAVFCVFGCPAAQPPAREVLESLRKARMDPSQLYRVHDVALYREELRIYLVDGTIAFLQPVEGRVTGAVFIGQGELLLIPPDAVEKASLALFTGVPVLNEKFSSSLFRFTDNTYEQLRQAIANPETAERIEDRDLIETWNPVVRNLHGTHEMRVLMDLLAEKPVPFLAGRFSGDRLGTFDISLDYRETEQLAVGQVSIKDGQRFGNVWCSFTVRSARGRNQLVPADALVPLRFRIDSRVLPSHSMQVRAEVDIRPLTGGERVLQFELSRFLKVSSVQLATSAGPVELEFFQNPLVEESEIRRRGNDQVTVVLPSRTVADQSFTLIFRYEGEVISDAGNGVLFVGARGIWYPNLGMRPAHFDLRFACPRRLVLVATGDRIEDKEEGEWRISRWKSRVPLRVAGFNLGEYEKGEARAGGIQIEVFANKQVEPDFGQPAIRLPIDPMARRTRATRPPLPLALSIPPPADMASVSARVAREAAQSVELFTKWFGPLPFGRVAISPIPGNFGQGWPGLVYASTMSYVVPHELTHPGLPRIAEIFYRAVLRNHELAHEWWGNAVLPAGLRDEWLIESLSNYAALMFLETRKGGDQDVKLVLDRSRRDLLEKVEDEPAERAGPPVLGQRLNSSRYPNGVDLVMYKKGTWIIHMLRQLMRDPKTGSDAAFFKFLRAVRQAFEDKPLSTPEFRALAEKFVVPAANLEGKTSLEWFFDQWVYSTGIPEIRVKSAVERRAGRLHVKGTVTLDGVDEGFALPVPVYAQTARGQVLLGIVSALGKETSFSFPVLAAPQKVLADPQNTLLAVMR